jgi:hypothetical protein
VKPPQPKQTPINDKWPDIQGALDWNRMEKEQDILVELQKKSGYSLSQGKTVQSNAHIASKSASVRNTHQAQLHLQ